MGDWIMDKDGNESGSAFYEGNGSGKRRHMKQVHSMVDSVEEVPLDTNSSTLSKGALLSDSEYVIFLSNTER